MYFRWFGKMAYENIHVFQMDIFINHALQMDIFINHVLQMDIFINHVLQMVWENGL